MTDTASRTTPTYPVTGATPTDLSTIDWNAPVDAREIGQDPALDDLADAQDAEAARHGIAVVIGIALDLRDLSDKQLAAITPATISAMVAATRSARDAALRAVAEPATPPAETHLG